MTVLPWLDYRWRFDFPVEMFATVCTRLRGTPARLEELLRGAQARRLTATKDGKWSALEHTGHLSAVEPLWQVRLREFLAGTAELTAADMSNAATAAARFNERPGTELCAGFRAARRETMSLLVTLTLADAARTARHPRLGVAMRLVDLCFFAAEHDDHHLAVIHELLVR